MPGLFISSELPNVINADTYGMAVIGMLTK